MSLSSILNQDLSYNLEAKQKFHKAAKSALNKLAKLLNLNKEDYSIKVNAGGFAVSGEVILHHSKFYLDISQSCLGKGKEIMYRSCKGQNDYTGGKNNFAPATLLDKDIDSLVSKLKVLLEKQ